MLLLLMIGIGAALDFSMPSLALGLPLLVLGTTVSTYLGLMMTRGIGWWDCILAVSAMLLLMATAVLAGYGDLYLIWGITFEVTLAALALLCRAIARQRWRQLDWMVCRSG